MTIIALAALMLAFEDGANAACNGEITVVVNGFRSMQGQAAVALFRGADGFPADSERGYRRQTVAIQKGIATLRFGSLCGGIYAISALHDENGNGKMDRNLLGMPKEGYGVSNDAKPKRFGPPSFAEASFEFHEPSRSVTIQLHYPSGSAQLGEDSPARK